MKSHNLQTSKPKICCHIHENNLETSKPKIYNHNHARVNSLHKSKPKMNIVAIFK